MTTSGIASTALDFLATIDPQDSVWDDGGIEGFVEQVHALATQKRHARDQCGIQRAIAALRAEVDRLPAGDVEIDLRALETCDLAKIDPASVLPRIEALTTAIATYRQDASMTSNGGPRTIAERAAIYQSMVSNLSWITKCQSELVNIIPNPLQIGVNTLLPQQLIHRRRGTSTPVSQDLWIVAYFLASCGQRLGDRPANPPHEFGRVGWGGVYVLFHKILGAGRNQKQFTKSLGNLRDYYDAFVNSGRKGWDPITSPMPRLGHVVMAEWRYRPREELWEYVKQFITR